jgi:hypothetical protein
MKTAEPNCIYRLFGNINKGTLRDTLQDEMKPVRYIA